MIAPPSARPTEGGRKITTAEIRGLFEQFLNTYPGHAFCDDCLTQRLGLEVREVRHARITLAGSVEFEQRMWFCSVCLEWRHVIHVAWLCFTSPESDPTC